MYADSQISADACEHGIFRNERALDGTNEPVSVTKPRKLQRLRGRCLLCADTSPLFVFLAFRQLVSNKSWRRCERRDTLQLYHADDDHAPPATNEPRRIPQSTVSH